MYCKHCGKKIADDSKFCPECGCSFSSSKSEIFNESNYSTQLQPKQKKWYQKKYKDMDSSDKKKLAGVWGISFVIIVISILIVMFCVPWSSVSWSTKNKNFEIIGTPSMTVEHNEYFGYSASIKGQAKNNGATTSYVSVTFNLYNASGNIIGSVMDNHNAIGKGEIWNFKATVGYHGKERPVRFVLTEIVRV